MPTASAERPEGRDASGIGFYFNADDTWHSGSEAPPQAWDPAWIAPPPTDRPAEPPVRRRRSGLAVALGLALVAAAAIALAWGLTPARRLLPQVPQTEPPSAVLIPPSPAPPAPATVAAQPARPAPARIAGPARQPAAAARHAPHHRQHLRTAHRRHASHPRARRSWRHAHSAALAARHGHARTRIHRASQAAL